MYGAPPAEPSTYANSISPSIIDPRISTGTPAASAAATGRVDVVDLEADVVQPGPVLGEELGVDGRPLDRLDELELQVAGVAEGDVATNRTGSPRSVVVSAPNSTSGIRVQVPTPNCSLSSRSVASMSSVTQQIWVIGPFAIGTGEM